MIRVSDGSSGLHIVPAAMGLLRGTIEQLRPWLRGGV